MTLEKFLAWEKRQELRYGFDGSGPVDKLGGTEESDRLTVNLTAALGRQLHGKPCRLCDCNLKILVGDGHIRYPEAFVSRSPIMPNATVVTDPVVVFEVAPAVSSDRDARARAVQYCRTASIQRYVRFNPSRPKAWILTRKGRGWSTRIAYGPSMVQMPEIDIVLPMGEIYDFECLNSKIGHL